LDNWHYFLNQIPQAEQIHKNRKQEIDRIVFKFEEIFGPGWWQYAAENQHPIFWSLNTFLWNPEDCALDELISSITKLKQIKGFDDVLARAKKANDYDSVETEIKLGSRLVAKCSHLAFNEPIGDKKPDISCIFEGQKLLIEVKTLLTAEETKKARKTQQEILQSCHGIFPYGKIFKVLSEQHLKDVKKEIEMIAREAINQNSPKVVSIPNVVKLLLIPNSVTDRLPIIQKYKNDPTFYNESMFGQLSGLVGPDGGTRPEFRVKIRLDRIKKEKQIPENNIGIVILASNDFMFLDEEYVYPFINSVIESVYELENITAVIFYNNNVTIGNDTIPKKIENDEFIFLEKTLKDHSQEYIIIIKNKYCKFNFDYNILVKLLSD